MSMTSVHQFCFGFIPSLPPFHKPALKDFGISFDKWEQTNDFHFSDKPVGGLSEEMTTRPPAALRDVLTSADRLCDVFRLNEMYRGTQGDMQEVRTLNTDQTRRMQEEKQAKTRKEVKVPAALAFGGAGETKDVFRKSVLIMLNLSTESESELAEVFQRVFKLKLPPSLGTTDPIDEAWKKMMVGSTGTPTWYIEMHWGAWNVEAEKVRATPTKRGGGE